jgi:hypothetical protein
MTLKKLQLINFNTWIFSLIHQEKKWEEKTSLFSGFSDVAS